MTDMVPSHVQARADEFGEVVAVLRHPNGRLYALAYWMYFVMFGLYPLVLVCSTIFVNPLSWWLTLLLLAVTGGLTYLLGRQAVGSVKRRQFFLYRGGYIATAPSGRIIRAVRWQDVAGIEGVEGFQMRVKVVGTRQRAVYVIQHAYGRPRPMRFTEVVGREVVAPLAEQLRVEAQPARKNTHR